MPHIPMGETLGQRIRELRGSRSRKTYARVLGISVPTLKRYESDERTPDADFLRALCEEAHIGPGWILWGGEGMSAWQGDGEVPVLLRQEDAPVWLGVSDQFIRIPYLPHRHADDGQEAAALPYANAAFSSQWLLRKGLDARHLCLVEALGEGMAPTIPEGSLLLVDGRESDGLVDAPYLVRIGRRLLPKRIQLEWDGGLLLRSDNPIYEDQHLSREEAQSLEVFGQIVWIAHAYP